MSSLNRREIDRELLCSVFHVILGNFLAGGPSGLCGVRANQDVAALSISEENLEARELLSRRACLEVHEYMYNRILRSHGSGMEYKAVEWR